MAGPSGAGAVAIYLKQTRAPRRSAQRDIRAAVRRESARSGGGTSELADFDCYSLCMVCGYLAEPMRGHPMRSESGFGFTPRCPSCGELGLADLRHTPSVEALCELERREAGPSFAARAARFLGSVSLTTVLTGTVVLLVTGRGDPATAVAEASLFVGPLALISFPWLASMLSRRKGTRRSTPRRWRLPRPDAFDRVGLRGRVRGTARASAGLIHAPLSGRPCLAYEVGVRDDANPRASIDSWRLLEQESVEFRVGEREVGRGEVLLRLPRERSSEGLVMSRDANARRYLRMRGFLDSEDVCVYETILAPEQDCAYAVKLGLTHVFA